MPRYNDVYQVCTHNSYWVKRSIGVEPFATGTQERLLDQLLFDHARALEIDIHKVNNKPGQWNIYHTGKLKNVFYQNLPEFLKQLQQFDYALPQHEVVTVVLELKEIFRTNFDETHTPEQLDSILEAYLGDRLFRPSDLMKRCPGKTDLCDCAASSPEIWPTIDELRGKFIFLVLGNFHVAPIGHGGQGWVTYANSKDASCFPMLSDFSSFNVKGGEKIPADMLECAYKASIFQQVENVNDTAHLAAVRIYMAKGGIVRGGNSFSEQEQHDRLRTGFHMLQTDFPWVHVGDRGYAHPLVPLDSNRFKDAEMFAEPGNRILVQSDTETFWSKAIVNGMNDWQTLPSSTRTTRDAQYKNPFKAYGKGCIRATADDLNSVTICRKVNDRQNARIIVTEVLNGQTQVFTYYSDNRTSGRVGDYIRLTVDRSSNGSVVNAYSSSSMQKDNTDKLVPVWNGIYTKHFAQTFTRQGIVASEGAVLFTGTKLNGADVMFTDGAAVSK